MAKDPAFLFYYQDFLVGTQFMTLEERGIYITALCHQADKGSIPEKHMLSICQAYGFTPLLKEKFERDENGHYYNARLREEILKRSNYINSRRNNAKAYAKHMEDENEDIALKDASKELFNKRYENLFFGDVPNDLINLASKLDVLEDADQWQDHVKKKIEELGYQVQKEVHCVIDEDRNGRIDLVASKGSLKIAIELDNRTPREKSIRKVKTFPIGIVLLRDPKLSKNNRSSKAIDDYVEFENDVMARWNALCDQKPALSKVKSISGSRRKHLKQRYTEAIFKDLGVIFEAIISQPFLYTPRPHDPKNPHSNWLISFDWLIVNDTNYLKVLERKYANDKNPNHIPESLRKYIKNP